MTTALTQPLSTLQSQCPAQQIDELPLLSEKGQIVVSLITQIVVRVLFPCAVLWLMASILPISFYAVALTTSLIGASLLASLFFQPDTFICPSPENEFPSNLGGCGDLQLDTRAVANHPGIYNHGNNCWINAITQAIRVVPFLNRWIRDPDEAPAALAPFSQFYDAYDQGAQANQRAVGRQTNTSQHLRLALSQISGIDPSIRVQEDAHQGLTPILAGISPFLLGQERNITYFSQQNLPPMAVADDATSERNLSFYALELSLPQNGPARLEEMIAHEMDDRNGAVGVNRMGSDGQVHRYPLERTQRIIERAPPFLMVQIKRFEGFIRPPSVLNGIPIVNHFFPAPVYQSQKNETPVEINDEITLQTEEGPRRYRLKSFIFHHGSTPKSGHYTAYGEENGERYCYDDTTVVRAEGAWDRKKSQAYVLLFEAI